MENIQIVIKEPGRKPYVQVIKSDLATMQKIVGGWLEVVHILYTQLLLVVNSNEPPHPSLKPNIHFFGKTLVGTMFVCTTNMTGLTTEQADDAILFLTVSDVDYAGLIKSNGLVN